MSSKLIMYIAVLLILSPVIVPSRVSATDTRYLTAAEESFTFQMASKIYRARSILDTYDKAIGNITALWEATRYPSSSLSQAASFDGCVPTNAPDTMADIADLWTTEVCNDFGYISSEVASFMEPETNIFDFTVGVGLIKLKIGRIRSMLSKIEGMIRDRIKELQDMRKAAEEAEKEAKKGLNLGDDFCFIATAAYGTPTAKEIDELRRFRDEYLRKSYLGNEFIEFYYENSPPIAGFISDHEIVRVVVRDGLVEPVVKVVQLTENLWEEN
jgi:hypothetical protein